MFCYKYCTDEGAHQYVSSYDGEASPNVRMTFGKLNIDMVCLVCGFLDEHSDFPLLRKTCGKLCNCMVFPLCEFCNVLLILQEQKNIFHKHHNEREY